MNHCPTPKKPKYWNKSLAESIVLSVNHNYGYNNEVYECVDHYHIRDLTKRKYNRHRRDKIRKRRQKQYAQMTIYDWMSQLNGTQGV